MNAPRFVTLVRMVAVAGCVVASAAAHAGGRDNVYWSVNIDAPTQGAGRVSTSFSNTRRGVYAEPVPVVYAPQPVVIQAPGRVYYRDEPRYYGPGPGYYGPRGYGYGPRPGARIARNVHNGLARLHQDIANFHAARAEAWSGGGRREWYGRDDDRRGYYRRW